MQDGSFNINGYIIGLQLSMYLCVYFHVAAGNEGTHFVTLYAVLIIMCFESNIIIIII